MIAPVNGHAPPKRKSEYDHCDFSLSPLYRGDAPLPLDIDAEPFPLSFRENRWIIFLLALWIVGLTCAGVGACVLARSVWRGLSHLFPH